jgi:hypothetical protein
MKKTKDSTIKQTASLPPKAGKSTLDLNKINLENIAEKKTASPKLKKANQILEKLKNDPQNKQFFSQFS